MIAYIWRDLFAILLIIFFPGMGQTQLIPNDDIVLNQDSLIYPVYDYEYIPDVSYDEMEGRLAELQNTIPLTLNNRVKAFIDYFTITDRDYTKEVLGKMRLYFPLMEKKLAEYGMPDELKYLAIVESGLNPRAKSRVGAIGLWQFMYGTARQYKLRIDWYVDERMDPEKSTDAACKYLKSLYDDFDDWELAMAAYNCGPGNVRKAIRRSGYKKKFWDIYRYLPRETRSYLPQYVAINYVANNAESHHFYIDDYSSYLPEADTLIVNHALYIKTLADLTGICPADIECLNPSLKRRAVPETAGNIVLNIPKDIKEIINQNRSYILDSARNAAKEELDFIARNEPGAIHGREKIIYTVKYGDALSLIAERYQVKVTDIKTWNDLTGNLIRVNQKLNIWVTSAYYSSDQKTSIAQTVPVQAAEPASGFHIVQPGDSLWKISKQYNGVSIETLKKLNNLESNKIIPGQKLKIG
ncbi:MAG TPA: transglycosylase SLT domain-containing protein [Cyclobacteriaceae bacterium]|nr:transglycosylase SLT domain-containing protein [Cyclobacteriaceae bacterium]